MVLVLTLNLSDFGQVSCPLWHLIFLLLFSKWVGRDDLSGASNTDTLYGGLFYMEQNLFFLTAGLYLEVGDVAFGGISTDFNELLTLVRVVVNGFFLLHTFSNRFYSRGFGSG